MRWFLSLGVLAVVLLAYSTTVYAEDNATDPQAPPLPARFYEDAARRAGEGTQADDGSGPMPHVKALEDGGYEVVKEWEEVADDAGEEEQQAVADAENSAAEAAFDAAAAADVTSEETTEGEGADGEEEETDDFTRELDLIWQQSLVEAEQRAERTAQEQQALKQQELQAQAAAAAANVRSDQTPRPSDRIPWSKPPTIPVPAAAGQDNDTTASAGKAEQEQAQAQRAEEEELDLERLSQEQEQKAQVIMNGFEVDLDELLLNMYLNKDALADGEQEEGEDVVAAAATAAADLLPQYAPGGDRPSPVPRSSTGARAPSSEDSASTTGERTAEDEYADALASLLQDDMPSPDELDQGAHRAAELAMELDAEEQMGDAVKHDLAQQDHA